MALSKKDRLLGVLDVGSTRVYAGIARLEADGRLVLSGFGAAPARGTRNGLIVDLDEVGGSIRAALAEAEKSAEAEVNRVFLGINSRGLKSFNSSGTLILGQVPAPITATHFQKCVEAASNVSLANTLETLHIIVRQCLVDEHMEVDNPLGMEGKRLEVGLHLMALPKTQITHFTKAANQAGLAVEKMTLQSLAAAEAVLSPEEKEFGAIFLDFGACTTTGLMYQRGKIQHSFSVPLGGDHITRDIIVGLRTTLKEAERIKCQHGTLNPQAGDDAGPFEVQGTGTGRMRQIAPQIVTEIIQPRTEEILEMARSEITMAGFELGQFSTCVLAGGGARLRELAGLTERTLDVPSRLGEAVAPDGWPGEFRSPAYASLVGLFQKAHVALTRRESPLDDRLGDRRPGAGRTTQRVKTWIQELFSI
jgi:cell division protein FtsA